jgi:Zn finger protein HypA/HybF involved in hydrogenase expression
MEDSAFQAAGSRNVSDQTRALIEQTKEGDFTFSPVAYYCKDCRRFVAVTEKRKLKYRCNECKGINVAFGTERSLKNYYKVKEVVKEEEENVKEK